MASIGGHTHRIQHYRIIFSVAANGTILHPREVVSSYAAKRIYQSYINKQNDYLDDEAKRHIASAVVEFVEQAWKCLRGPEKLQKALETARVMLEKKGIDFDAGEMTVLIEACLAEFNEAFKNPLLDGSTAAAIYRPYEGPQQADSTEAITE